MTDTLLMAALCFGLCREMVIPQPPAEVWLYYDAGNFCDSLSNGAEHRKYRVFCEWRIK